MAKRWLWTLMVGVVGGVLGRLLVAAPAPVTGTIVTIAGTGVQGSSGDGGAATAATLDRPVGLALDSSGNLYVSTGGAIRRIDGTTGIITTVAPGSGQLTFDAQGNLYYTSSYRVWKLDLETGVTSLVAGIAPTGGFGGFSGDGGLATLAQLDTPSGLAVDSAGNTYICDFGNHRVRRVAADTGIITTVAGTGASGWTGDGGPAALATLASPFDVAIAGDGTLYISEYGNARIRRIDGTTGTISTIAGVGGPLGFSGEAGLGTSAKFNGPLGIALDGRGNLLIVDQLNHRVRQLSLTTGIITTVAGSGALGSAGDGGLATAASLRVPNDVVVDRRGNIYIADSANHRIRRVATPSHPSRLMSTLAGTGTEGFSGDTAAASVAQIAFPTSVAVDNTGNVFIADSVNGRVRRVDGTTGVITTVAGTGERGSTGDGNLAVNARVEALAVAVDTAGNLYLVDQVNRRVRKVTVATGIITHVAGSGLEGDSGDGGLATLARFTMPMDVAIDVPGHLYIADRSAHRIRRVDAATGIITTVAGTGEFGFTGDGGAATAARLNDPTGIAVDTQDNLYIVDRGNHRVRKVTAATGEITTIAGTGTAGYSGESTDATLAALNEPFDVTVDAAGNVFVADAENRRIRMITPGGIISTVAGATSMAASELSADSFGGDGGAATAALLRQPRGIAVDADGSLYIADDVDHRVRKAANPPLFTTQPADISVITNTSATFTAAASGSPAYRWQSSVDDGATWSDLTDGPLYSGAATSTLLVSPATIGLNGQRYRLSATNAIATSFSTEAILTVNSVSAPAFTTQPGPLSVPAGQDATFSAVVTGFPAPTLRWHISTNAGVSFTPLNEVAPYAGVTTNTLTITGAGVGLNGARYRLIANNSQGTTASDAALLTVHGDVSAAPRALRFNARKAGAAGAITHVTPAQAVTVDFTGAGSTWVASVSVPWLQVTQGSGSGAGRFFVEVVNPLNEIGGSTALSETVTIYATGAPNGATTVTVELAVTHEEIRVQPFGQVDTPVQDAAGVQGAVGITGWALDDVGVVGVQVFRNCLPYEEVPGGNCQTILPGTPEEARVVFVGDAAFLAGARPDVAAGFSTFPLAHRAGWGMLMLTPMLPDVGRSVAYGGVGPLVVYAVATDVEGNQVLLGRSSDPASPALRTPTSITMANDTIAKPFGSIDTPALGETISGVIPNFGWALTPDANTTGGEPGDVVIPTNGSTMFVFIDDLPVATVVYNQCRVPGQTPSTFCADDVSNIFGNPTPQPSGQARTTNTTRFRNLDVGHAPIGAYVLDTRTLSNGLHTIAWSVTDSLGRVEGIGSRFFTVLNSGADQFGGAEALALQGSADDDVRRAWALAPPDGLRRAWALAPPDSLRRARALAPPDSLRRARALAPPDGLLGRTGFDLREPWTPMHARETGRYRVRLPEMGRLELWLSTPVDAGYLVAPDGSWQDLPVGARVDGARFGWGVPVGYHGTYALVFVRGAERLDVDVTVAPVARATDGEPEVRMHLDVVRAVGRTVQLDGWAYDPRAALESGIGAVHVWARLREPGAEPVFVGEAALNVARPDVARAHPDAPGHAGFSLAATLAPGTYEFTAYVWNVRTARWEDARTVVGHVR